MASKSIVMNSKDNIATTLEDLTKGEDVKVEIKGDLKNIKINDDIPFGHKFSIVEIKKGSDVVKYGEVIGMASEDIKKGDYVHVHNLESKRARGDLKKRGVN
jgi:altronate dehydratase small subunit